MTHHIECPSHLEMPALFDLAQGIQQAPAADHYELDFRRPPFAKPFMMLYLANAINQLRLAQPEATFATLTSRSDSCAYMSHLGFFDACGLVDAHHQPMNSPGAGINYIPITTWQVSDLRQQARAQVVEIGELIEMQAEEMARVLTRQQRGDLVDILVYSLREIMRNVVEHSESDTLMYCAQFWPRNNQVEVAILDAGIGIAASLRQNPHIRANNDYDALKLSVLPGISSKAFRGKHRNPHDVWANTGYGLYMVRRLCEKGGTLTLSSGDAALYVRQNESRQYHCQTNGTAISLHLDLNEIGSFRKTRSQFLNEGDALAKELLGEDYITASLASRMLRREFPHMTPTNMQTIIPAISTEDRATLRQLMAERFNIEELKDVVFDLGVDHERFPHPPLSSFCRELIAYFERIQNLSCLLTAMIRLRPAVREFAEMLATLGGCQPRAKTQIILPQNKLTNRPYLLRDLARLLDVSPEEIALIATQPGSIKLLVGLPEEAAKRLVEIEPEMIGNTHQVSSVTLFSALPPQEQAQWRQQVLSAPDAVQQRLLNPITYTEKVISDFLRYQVTTYPFADAHLYEQMRSLLNLEHTRRTPLMKGPYITLSKSFRQGASIQQLVAEGLLHPHMVNIAAHPNLFGHQEKAIRAITGGQPTLVSTGTGSGKTETFLYPIISHCLRLRDEKALTGITAVIVYPMNALAEDQLERLRGLLAGTGISFGMYIGKTPELDDDAVGVRLPHGSSKADYEAKLAELAAKNQRQAVFPYEERISRDSMRQSPPRILLTNVKQLELLLTRQRDVQLFDGATLDYLVFDEAHTFSGAAGAETAVLIRRLRAFCGRAVDETVCIATSATIVDAERGPEAGRDFASRFFGVNPQTVALVGEEYEPDQWAESRTQPPPFPGDTLIHLQDVLTIVDADTAAENERAATILRSLLGIKTVATSWRADVYDYLSRNELVYQLVGALIMPRELPDLLKDLKTRLKRDISEEELLLWLALGAAARKRERPFMRPVVHAFVRGVSGAVVTFPEGWQRPKLWLSAIDAADDEGDYRLNVLTCSTCGQHYFEHFLRDFSFTDKVPEGGELTPHGQLYWQPLEQVHEGDRVILLDQLISQDEDEEEQTVSGSQPLWFCAACGTMHSDHLDRCASCGEQDSLLQLWVVKQDDKNPGKLYRCVSCGTNGRRASGGRYREPAKPVRATTVSDVHVLAQNMIQHARRKRLLVFSDNRQDAAFQAGWMKDHARRFRLRSLMYGRIQQGPISIGDLTAHLDDLLNKDDDLSQSLAPEVWRVHRKQAETVKHNEQRKYFLRIQVLRELTTGVRQRIGLEPWGRIQLSYRGLYPDLPFIQEWAKKLDLTPQDLLNGIASLLDTIRRKSILLDREGYIFSKYWNDGDFEIQRGYMPKYAGVPVGLKLTRDPNDSKSRVQQWLSETGHQTSASQAVRSWGVPATDVGQFLQDLWTLLTAELNILVPTSLTGFQNKQIRGTQGVYQIDADKLLIKPNEGVYRCQTCRRVQVRPTPNNICMGWRCGGTLQFEDENPDDYDLMVLDQQFTLLRPEEHSAQVPNDKRERLERAFKSETSNWVNTIVATPTLEMGVDIGGLDAILMRNVPPLPSNYWQRAGRAGRRFRMAVNLTYARNASHDRAYFEEPLKLLNGIIYPPRINLRNELMIQKHVHATVLTSLNQLRRDKKLNTAVRQDIDRILNICFPTYIKTYLFDDNGFVLAAPLDVSILATLIAKHETTIMQYVLNVFSAWPTEDELVVAEELLQQHIREMASALTEVIARIWKRLQWAMDQMRKLDDIRIKKGTLDAAEDALYARCDRLVKKLKGLQSRRRSESEGFDDTYTYGVLAAEGFLPGYGLGTGAIVGTAQIPITQRAFLNDFDLPRPSGVALREYAPGNLIYANGNRFVPRFYHLEPDAPILYQVDIENEAASEIGTAQTGQTSLGTAVLPIVPIADVDMPHVSHITDDEDYRFQMPVTVIGYEQQRHAGGKGYDWGGKALQSRHNVHLRLLNVGAAQLTGLGTLGYPVSLISGQSRSPLSSDAELHNFREAQLERYGERVQDIGFYADVIADALSIQDCNNRIEAYSVAESLRMGAANVIDMEVEDLQLLCIGKPGQEEVDILIYDPMPGGSGLLEQLLEKWNEVVEAALAIVKGCPSVCEQACIDCLMTYRNSYYHRHLDRHIAAKSLMNWGSSVIYTHDIQAKLPNVEDTSGEMPVNEAESRLLGMIQRAGFPTPAAQHPIELGKPLGRTIPDFFYDDSTQNFYEGICIYLDGMSRHIHGNRETQQRDQAIREELRNREYEVITIPFNDLMDRKAMAGHFYRLGKILVGRGEAKKKREDTGWFEK